MCRLQAAATRMLLCVLPETRTQSFAAAAAALPRSATAPNAHHALGLSPFGLGARASSVPMHRTAGLCWNEPRRCVTIITAMPHIRQHARWVSSVRATAITSTMTQHLGHRRPVPCGARGVRATGTGTAIASQHWHSQPGEHRRCAESRCRRGHSRGNWQGPRALPPPGPSCRHAKGPWATGMMSVRSPADLPWDMPPCQKTARRHAAGRPPEVLSDTCLEGR
jgi:hypothetical protein